MKNLPSHLMCLPRKPCLNTILTQKTKETKHLNAAQKTSKIPTKQTTNNLSHKINALNPRSTTTDLRDELVVVVITLSNRLLCLDALIIPATNVLPVTSPVVIVSAFTGLIEG